MPPRKYLPAGTGKGTEERSKPTKGRGQQSPTARTETSPRVAATGNDPEHNTVVTGLRKNTNQISKTEKYKDNSSAGSKTYMNRETTGSPRSVHDQSENSNTSDRREPSYKIDPDNMKTSSEPKVYKDNAFNRRLGRVGKPHGTAVHSRKEKSVSQKTYTDNALNRKLRRVGLPLGSMPVQNKTSLTRHIPEILEKINNDDALENFTVDYQCTASQSGGDESAEGRSNDTMVEAFEQAMCHHNRKEAVLSWQRQSEIVESRPKTLQTVLDDYEGKIIKFSDLKLHKRIGQGAFGEVYFAKWCETVVAVKKLRATKLFDKRVQEFAKEVMNFCKLDHPNIVKFIGACTEMPNICIVMEYMQMSLHDAIHLPNDVNFSETEKTDVVKQTCEGVMYLHASRIAHCDLKTLNVLLDYVEGHICVVKITDFGLSMVKANTITSGSGVEEVRNAGTPRYSAPELLRGELLSAKNMMKADVYSLSLIILEVIFEQEPFPTYNRQKLREKVGEKGEAPELPNAPTINQEVVHIIKRSWSFKSQDRPDIAEICGVFRKMHNIYAEEMPPNIVESLSNLQL